MTCYHGTDADLKVGDRVLPGPQVGRTNHHLSEPGRVHLTPYPGIARVFAQDFADGGTPTVYAVEPEGDVQEHGSFVFEPSVEFRADAAVVVGVLDDEDIDDWDVRYEVTPVAVFWRGQGWRYKERVFV